MCRRNPPGVNEFKHFAKESHDDHDPSFGIILLPMYVEKIVKLKAKGLLIPVITKVFFTFFKNILF